MKRTPLLRMILLLTFVISVLIVFTIHKSSKYNYSKNPNYREIFFWQDENKAYSLLLHSVIINDSLFSAYSIKWDSLMMFSASPYELQSIKKKIQDHSFNKHECSSCHIDLTAPVNY